jgi:hypothetical protein
MKITICFPRLIDGESFYNYRVSLEKKNIIGDNLIRFIFISNIPTDSRYHIEYNSSYLIYLLSKLFYWTEAMQDKRMIDWYLTSTLAVFKLYRGVKQYTNKQ